MFDRPQRRVDHLLLAQSDKSRHSDTHPIFSWALTADDKEVTVWNYEEKAIVFQFSLPLRCGDVKAVRFFDNIVRYWKLRKELSRIYVNPENDVGIRGGAFNALALQPHTIVVVCENRLVLYDYEAKEIREIKTSQFDGKSLLSLEFAYTFPWLFLGCSDGAIRVYDIEAGALIKRLQSKEFGSRGVVQMLTINRGFNQESVPYIVGTASDGTVLVYEVVTGEVKASLGEVKGSVDDMAFHPALEILMILANGTLYSFDTRTWGFNGKMKLEEPVKFFVLMKHGGFQPCSPEFAACLLITKDGRVLEMIDTRSVREVFDVTQYFPALPRGEKLRVYSVCVHPLQPQIFTVCTNHGMLMTQLDSFSVAPTFCLLPMRHPESPFPRRGLYFTANTVKSVSFGSDQESAHESRSDMDPVRSVIKTADARDILTDARSGWPGGPVELRVSPSGRLLSLLWPVHGVFEIYVISSQKRIERGQAYDLAWAWSCDRYALVDCVVDAPQKGTWKDKKKKGPSSFGTQFLDIKEVDFTSATAVRQITRSSGFKLPISAILGGPLLGVVQVTGDGDISTSDVLQFHAWDGKEPIGRPLPRPHTITWESTMEYCLLVYEKDFCIFTVKPVFKLLNRLPGTVTSSLWYKKILFYVTPTEICCLLPGESFLSIPLAQVYFSPVALSVAFQSDGEISKLVWPPHNTGEQEVGGVPCVQERPCGPLTLVEITGKNSKELVCVDVDFKFHIVDLECPSLSFCLAVFSGSVEQASRIYQSLSPCVRDNLMRFLVSRGYSSEALQIMDASPDTGTTRTRRRSRGVSLSAESELRMVRPQADESVSPSWAQGIPIQSLASPSSLWNAALRKSSTRLMALPGGKTSVMLDRSIRDMHVLPDECQTPLNEEEERLARLLTSAAAAAAATTTTTTTTT